MNVLAFDTETKGLDWYDEDNEVFLITWANDVGEYIWREGEDLQPFLDAVEEADVIVAHNMPFDVHQTRESFGIDLMELIGTKQFHDTDIMARLAIPAGQSRPSYKLKDLGQTYIRPDAAAGEEAIKKIAKKMKIKLKDDQNGPATKQAYYLIWRAYPEVMEKYALLDARLTWDLHALFLSDDKRIKFPLDESFVWSDIEQPVQPILINAERVGVALDQSVVQEIKKEYEDLLRTHERRLLTELPAQALGGEGSEDALINAFLEMGVPLEVMTPASGKFSTAAWALEPFIEEYPIIESYLGYETCRKFLNTFIAPMDGRAEIHTNFGQCEAWTGRMSSWKPNLQNLPVRSESATPIRSMFVPRKGHSFVVMDYDSIEIRVYAHYANVQEFRDDITNGRDIHAWMAAQIDDSELTEDDFKKGTPGEKARALAKRTVFGILYGLGGKGLTSKEPGRFDPGPFFGPDHPKIVQARSQGREWPKPGYQFAEAKAFITKIKKALPGYYKLNKRVKDTVIARGYLNTLYDRKQVVHKEKAYVGMNALIQGTAADLMKLGLIKVHEAIQKYEATILLVVHDEVVVEVPTEYAEACAEAVREAMKAATDKLDPALEVSGTVVETNYADAK